MTIFLWWWLGAFLLVLLARFALPSKSLRGAAGWLAVALAAVGLLGWFYADMAWRGQLGRERDEGDIAGKMVPSEVLIRRDDVQARAAQALGGGSDKQIFFGDLHVHTTYSTDAFMWALPIMHGQGTHPLADACDYARYCSQLDFWGISDHAEASTPLRWSRTKESIRECQAVGGDGPGTDLTSFVGFEWTQVGQTPDDHYGHSNVFFKGLGEADLPPRAINSGGTAVAALRSADIGMTGALALADWPGRQNYWDFNHFMRNLVETPLCDPDIPSHELSPECAEVAETPGDLVRRLVDEQGLDPLIIPHGQTWGLYTPPGTSMDKALRAENRPDIAAPLLEIYSGHGNSEEYRRWRAVIIGEDNTAYCPEPSEDYIPACWRMGEIIHERCMNTLGDELECAVRRREARDASANMLGAGHLSVPGLAPEELLDAGQCTDCFQAAFNYRPMKSAQYGLAIRNFDGEEATRFTYGFIASSDNHRARPGTGYKEVDRRLTTEGAGAINEQIRQGFTQSPFDAEPVAKARRIDRETLIANASLAMMEGERQSSFFMTGGLAAVHAKDRSREEIWAALRRKETYATSGPRILLWFDMLNAPGGPKPMGSQLDFGAEPPQFEVRAAGSFKQLRGCPDFASEGLPADRLDNLCRGECYNPSGERYKITRIEIIRILPQLTADESVDGLITDPWKVLPCDDDGAGCTVRFSDEDYPALGRDAVYYARAIQEPTMAINADPLRCVRDEFGQCIEVNLCYGDYRSGDDECLSQTEHRAWASPIFVDWAGGAAPVLTPAAAVEGAASSAPLFVPGRGLGDISDEGAGQGVGEGAAQPVPAPAPVSGRDAGGLPIPEGFTAADVILGQDGRRYVVAEDGATYFIGEDGRLYIEGVGGEVYVRGSDGRLYTLDSDTP